MKDGLNEKDSVIRTDNIDEVMDRHEYINILRRHIQDNPRKALMAKHRMWMDNVRHEYPLPYIPYRIGVYIRYYNQTRHENYIEKHKQQFIDDIAMCPKWELVDFYIDKGMAAPHMENSKEWCRLLEDCFSGRVNLIVTQKVSSVSSDPEEMTFLSHVLAAQKRPVGIYFISEDIYTLASYYTQDIHQGSLLPEGWKILPEDEIDRELMGSDSRKMLEDSLNNETESMLGHAERIVMNYSEEE